VQQISHELYASCGAQIFTALALRGQAHDRWENIAKLLDSENEKSRGISWHFRLRRARLPLKCGKGVKNRSSFFNPKQPADNIAVMKRGGVENSTVRCNRCHDFH
jgi:hypothetical protein